MTTPHLVVLLGSHREGRFGPTVGEWVADRARHHGAFSVEVLDPAAHDLPLQHPADRHAAAGDFLAALAGADAVLVVTPEYNHSFPGILKLALDLVGDELTDTPVGIVTYGGMSHGLRAAEALRPVLSALRAVAVTDTVGLAGARDRFDDAGALVVDPTPTEQALTRLLDDLARFTHALATPIDATTDVQAAA
jgi:NAD(P)H-dependent FMN reductase